MTIFTIANIFNFPKIKIIFYSQKVLRNKKNIKKNNFFVISYHMKKNF